MVDTKGSVSLFLSHDIEERIVAAGSIDPRAWLWWTLGCSSGHVEPGWVIAQVDNWRFLRCRRRSLGVMCMGEQLESDSLPLPLSLSSRVVIELPAGVRPTGGFHSRQAGSASAPRCAGEVIP